ncbi:hypothetical protein FSARC_6453 [Fusarium sarcochroum]|uniref:Uncharacterized protein n=1 Tax=Fusarium sarcochroum TaxID=1208366 RepID=A0A8H4TXC3_9HYPO|nr:hypothetical protein FSARC_6453 [Fusarium sarcochroum]
MKACYAFAALSLYASQCLAASVDMWSSPEARNSPAYKSIKPEVIKARLGTTPKENSEGDRKPGSVYFCREENWGPPCFVYHPTLEYTCTELGEEIKGHIGSVFVDPEIICRLAKFENDRCAPIKFFAWPETQKGWPDLFHQSSPDGPGKLGSVTTHFTCAKCTNCVRDPK